MCFVHVFALEFSSALKMLSLSDQQIICGTKLMKLQIESGLNFQQSKKTPQINAFESKAHAALK